MIFFPFILGLCPGLFDNFMEKHAQIEVGDSTELVFLTLLRPCKVNTAWLSFYSETPKLG